MKILLKILVAPFALALSLLAALLVFLFDICAVLLTIASVTRGIENPNPRTCLVQIKCGIADWMAMLIAVAFFIFELCMRGGVTG